MHFDLDQHSGVPIYVQLKEQIKLAVATGNFLPGEKLPTVRQLAIELKINPNTVSRVYSALEQEGILATRQGKGTFVREEADISEEGIRGENLERVINKFFVEVHQLGFSTEEALEKITELSNKQLKGGERHEPNSPF